MSALSTLASFDDIRRCVTVLTDGTAEEEFHKFTKLQEQYRQQWLAAVQEAQRLQKELDISLQNMADLETKLFHARRLLEMENKARKEAECERDQMEKRIVAVADLLKNERDIRDETKDKLAFLNTLPTKKRKSVNKYVDEKCGNDINSTGSFLSDLSLTQSEDDFLDMKMSKTWKKHRPSYPRNSGTYVGSKKARVSTDAPPPVKRQSNRHSIKHMEIGPNDKICATTTLSIPNSGDGPIRAESIIKAIPTIYSNEKENIPNDNNEPRSPLKKRTSPFKMFTPTAPSLNEYNGFKATPPPFDLKRSMMRKHNFVSKTFLRTDTCTHCQKKIRFGSLAQKCRDCHVSCHSDCRDMLKVTCVPQTGTPTMKGPMGFISDHAPTIPPMIPALVVHCVNEIETRGLNEIGIYRVSGSEREVKALKERFLRAKGTPHLGNIDIHVLCGCVKDFLRSLREPLIPTELWKYFSNAVQNVSDEAIQTDLYRAIDNLPQANRDTLAFLIMHFQRIAECEDVKMPIENIARVFGPTIVGYSSPDPDQHAIVTETRIQFYVMQNLMKIPTEYWSQYVALEDERLERGGGPTTTTTPTPTHSKESMYSLYATPLKGTLKKRKFYATSPYSNKKK